MSADLWHWVEALGLALAVVAAAIVLRMNFAAWKLRRIILLSEGRETPPELQRRLNAEALRAGRSHLNESGILICGLTRNNAAGIDASLHNVYASVVPHFKSYKILVLENDSADSTRAKLLAWNRTDPNLVVLGCGEYNAPECKMGLERSRNHAPEDWRIEKMVILRNHLLEEIEKEQYADYRYVMMIDFDLMGVIFQDGLLDTGFHLSKNPDIDCVCALGLEFEFPFGRLKYHDPYAHSDAQTACMTMREKDKVLYPTRGLRDHGMEKLESCFNGLAIYNRASLKGKRYCTYLVKDVEPVCEHVCLNKSLREVYMNNDFLFIMNLTPYAGRAHGHVSKSAVPFHAPRIGSKPT